MTRMRPAVLCLAAVGLLGCATGEPSSSPADPVAAADQPETTLRLRARALPSLPTPVSNNAVAAVRRPDGSMTLYSLMGITDPNDSDTITTACYALDLRPSGEPASDSWRRIADAPALFERGKIGASAVAVGGKVYLIGGYAVVETEAGETVEVTEERLFRFDESPIGGTWTELSPVPTAVDDTAAAVHRGRWIYLFSGWHGPARDNVRRVQVYDVLTDEWSQADPIPGPGVFGHVAAIAGGVALVADGTLVEQAENNRRAFAISDNVYIGRIDPADPAVIDWRRAPAHPGEPTYRAGAAVGADGLVHIIGGTSNPYNIDGVGYNGEPSTPLAQHLVFDPAGGSWRVLHEPAARMDLRGLIPTPGGLVQVGGMTGPAAASARVQ